eukprot:TRINITY_DN26397_c0_g1_i1.p2 TRINITY_DN26397_c0_g1~~TRINITY_DN26397_c0_g1_i1.p2  ORF type:complete len:114 (+),score=9.58 TRINITY_DN26397_c0_g1_i1:236-577(+)
MPTPANDPAKAGRVWITDSNSNGAAAKQAMHPPSKGFAKHPYESSPNKKVMRCSACEREVDARFDFSMFQVCLRSDRKFCRGEKGWLTRALGGSSTICLDLLGLCVQTHQKGW